MLTIECVSIQKGDSHFFENKTARPVLIFHRSIHTERIHTPVSEKTATRYVSESIIGTEVRSKYLNDPRRFRQAIKLLHCSFDTVQVSQRVATYHSIKSVILEW